MSWWERQFYKMAVNYQVSGTGTGTHYTLTTSYALIHQGTTDPQIVLAKPGTYLIKGFVFCHTNAATFAATRIVGLKYRRTNNTAADVGLASTVYAPIMTTFTQTLFAGAMEPVIYTTTNDDDALELQAYITALPTAGSVGITKSMIIAIRLY